jgi:hypothetical protein
MVNPALTRRFLNIKVLYIWYFTVHVHLVYARKFLNKVIDLIFYCSFQLRLKMMLGTFMTFYDLYIYLVKTKSSDFTALKSLDYHSKKCEVNIYWKVR